MLDALGDSLDGANRAIGMLLPAADKADEQELIRLRSFCAKLINTLSTRQISFSNEIERFCENPSLDGWDQLKGIVTELAEEATRMFILLRREEGDFVIEGQETYRALAMGLSERQTIYKEIEKMSYPLTEDDIKSLKLIALNYNGLRKALSECQRGIADYVKRKQAISGNQRQSSPQSGENEHVVILVHGIRDFASWQERVGKVLRGDFIVETTNYGRFDLFRFLTPIQYFRNAAIERVWGQIRDIKKQHPNAKYSFVAHSFGTYIVAHILKRNFDLTAHRIIFCGSVVKYNFSFEEFSERFTTPIMNEVGTEDIWPAVAESITWGYGWAGTYGFRRPRVRDRWHSGAKHGYFLDPQFCYKYWIPFLKDGTIIDGDASMDPPTWLRLISTIHLKYIIIIAIALAFFIVFPAKARVCYPYTPINDVPDTSRAPRQCLHGRLSYVKWIDESGYPAVDRATGRWPNDRANRSLAITGVDENGTPIWTEQNLLRIDADRSYWQAPKFPGAWTEIVADLKLVVLGQTGTLLRRQDPNGKCDSTTNKRTILETFLQADLKEKIERQDGDVQMRFRWVAVDCVDNFPLGLGSSKGTFDRPVGRVVRAATDP